MGPMALRLRGVPCAQGRKRGAATARHGARGGYGAARELGDVLRIGSLFSGIGGLELGLEWAGVGHTVFQVERDPYASQVLARHWPDAVRFDDVRTVGAHNLPACDVLCGGFPCQDVSLAGAGVGGLAGLAGSRSGLWGEFARIIGEVRPSFAVVENVSHLLAVDGGAGFARVLADLAALGFDAWWDCLPASAVGAPHRRDRIFLVAYASSPRGAGPIAGETARQPGSWGWRGAEDLRAIADAPFVNGDRWPQPIIRRVDDGIPDRVARLRAYGNAVVPAVGYFIGRVVMTIAEGLS